MRVQDESDIPAAISDDGAQLTIEVASGQEIVTDGSCELVGDQPNIVACAHGTDHPPSLSIATAAIGSAAPLPQAGSVSYGETLVFLSSGSDEAGPPAAVAFSYRTESTVCCAAPADSVDVSWDGETATIAAPDGYSVEPVDRGVCATEPDQPNVADCTATGTLPNLLAFTTSTIGQQRQAHSAPLSQLVLPQIAAPPGPARAGTPVSLTANAQSFLPRSSLTAPMVQSYIWDFGDGSLANGQTVSHIYQYPGIYTAEVILVGPAGPLSAKGTIIQILPIDATLPPVRVDVTYPAGWNLVAGPSGTVLSGASDPLYRLSPAPGAPYQTVSATAPLEAGSVYWAYFGEPTTVTLHGPGQPVAVNPLPGIPVPLGNPLTAEASVSGSNHLYVYDPASSQYHEAKKLDPGQGAWASTGAPPSGPLPTLVAGYTTP